MNKFICCFVLIAISEPAFSLSKVGHAWVQQKDGLPCFGIKDEYLIFKNKYKIFGIGLTDEAEPRTKWNDPYTQVWGFDFYPRGAFEKVTEEYCFKYGVLPDNAEERARPEILKLNNIYNVSIYAEKVGETISTAGYGALFCLTRDSDGGIKIHSTSSVAPKTSKAELEKMCSAP